jgi:heme exporter protein C
VATTAAALLLGLVVAPPDAIQGDSQRLMYVHVPAAWLAFAAFGLVALCSAGVLLRDDARWHATAGAAAELGVAMTALALLEGSLWGQTAWGTWWTWDPRLVTTAALLLLYVAYLLLRRLPGPERRVRRRAAVAGLVFVVQVPVVHFSVLWWRTLHQPPSVLRPDVPTTMAPSMLVALGAAVLAFTVAGLWFVANRRRTLLATPGRAPEPGEAAR